MGIASADVFPRSFPRRMSMGIWPPSKPAGILLEPERDFWPFVPRPAVLPVPDPTPRPSRFRAFRAWAGRRLERFRSSVIVLRVLSVHAHEVSDLAKHPAQLRRVRLLDAPP